MLKSRKRITAFRAPLLRFVCLSKSSPRPGTSLVRCSHPVVSTTSWFPIAGCRSYYRSAPFLRLRPRFRVWPSHPRVLRRFRSLEVFRPLSATHPSRATHSREFQLPGHVASSRFRCASTPFSLDKLPDLFQPGALTGFVLQSLTWPESHSLSTMHPLLRLAVTGCRHCPANRDCHRRTSPRVAAFNVPSGPPNSLLSERPFDRTTVSRIINGPDAATAPRLCSATTSLQGFPPPAGWDVRPRISPALSASWLSWSSSSLGLSPSRASG